MTDALFIRLSLRLVPVESTHDLAKLRLLPILYSVSRVNAYLNSQHPYECPYYKLPVFRQGELGGFVGTVDLRCPGLILQPMLEV